MTTLIRLRLRDRLSFRIGLFVAASIVVGDIVANPIYEYVLPGPGPYGEGGSLGGEEWTRTDTLQVMGLSLTYALTLGCLLGWFASRYSLPRLSAIAAQAEGTIDDELPGPFDEKGRDEIAQVAKALNAMRGRISSLLDRQADRDAKRNEWVAQVSHDLRTPLTALVTSLEHSALLLERGEASTDQLRENNAEALFDTQRVTALAEDLLDIASLEIDHALNAEEVLPGEVIHQALAGLAPLVRKAGLNVDSVLGEDLPTLEADGRLVLRALENLIANAIQHAQSWIRVSANYNDGSIRFAVEDDGPGLPNEQSEASFSDMRKHRSRPDSVGLGLMVTQRVAEAHGGQAAAESRAEGGAKVWFALPAASDTW